MAYLFDDASTQYLSLASAPVTVAPMTVACWFNTDDTGSTNQDLVSIGDNTVTNHFWTLYLNQGATNDRVRWFANAGGASQAVATANHSVNTWHHACGIERSATDRSAYLDGGNRGDHATSRAPSGAQTTRIGYRADSTPINPMSGLIAEVGIWNIDLTDPEVAALATGISPLLVRPGNIVMYVPLVRSLDDYVGGNTFTNNNGAVVSAHPRVYYPTIPYIITSPTVGGLTTEYVGPTWQQGESGGYVGRIYI